MCKINSFHNRLYVLLSFVYVLFSFGLRSFHLVMRSLHLSYALFSFGYVFFPFRYVIILFGYALFSFGYVLFSFRYVLFPFFALFMRSFYVIFLCALFMCSFQHAKTVGALLLLMHSNDTNNLLQPSIAPNKIRNHLTSLWLVSICQR